MCVEISASGNEGLFVPSRTVLLCCFSLLPSSFQHILLFFVGPFEEGQEQQLLGTLLKTLLRNAVVKKLLISKLSGSIIKA